MRAVLQRVTRGSVRVDDEIVGSVDQGFVILVGVGHDDGENEAQWLARKIAGLRVFEDDDGKFNRSLLDVDGGCLVVSQFTLLADCRKGRRPSYIRAAPPETVNELYTYFVERVRIAGIPAETGRFGADMAVSLVNDGPVTIIVDSKEH